MFTSLWNVHDTQEDRSGELFGNREVVGICAPWICCAEDTTLTVGLGIDRPVMWRVHEVDWIVRQGSVPVNYWVTVRW
jgi:hypothetical protein